MARRVGERDVRRRERLMAACGHPREKGREVIKR
jgi:hypothetical protein